MRKILPALCDFAAAMAGWRQWLFMAATEVLMHYRRSILGPFWLSINVLVMTLSLGLVYSLIFKMEVDVYVPYFVTGYLAWSLILALFNEGATTFIANATAIKNVNIPLPFFAMKVVAKQMFVFFHLLVALIPVYVFFPAGLSVHVLLLPAALLIYAVTGVAICMIMGVLCSRFRDLTNITANLLQVAFFVTPIFWPASALGKPVFTLINPFYHYIEIVRAPLLGGVPSTLSMTVVGIVTPLLLVVSLAVFARYRTRIVHMV